VLYDEPSFLTFDALLVAIADIHFGNVVFVFTSDTEASQAAHTCPKLTNRELLV
jgi:hypothetical protein